ncbi:MAG: DNA repair protein RecO [Saprospiraceae bacterium]|nr:DNA repair protein RecO [Saprospiraceae bacterium]
MIHTRGIVFRCVRYRESSLILDVLTETHGLLSFIMNGVFKKTDQRLASVLSSGNLIQLVAYYSEQKSLHRIKEVQFSYIYQNIPQDIKKSAMILFMTELCAKCIKESQRNTELYQYIQRCYMLVDKQDPIDPGFHLKFMLGLTSFLGFYPSERNGPNQIYFDLLNGIFVEENVASIQVLDEEESSLLNHFIRSKSQTEPIETSLLNSSQRKTILDILTRYYSLHIEHFGPMQSPIVYRNIFG